MNFRQTIAISSSLAAILAVLLLLVRNAIHDRKCSDLLRTGRWSVDYKSTNDTYAWQPFGSVLHSYDSSLVSKCLHNQTLFFIGDSSVRQLFWATAAKLDNQDASKVQRSAAKHQDQTYVQNGVALSFLWDPFLARSETADVLNGADSAIDIAAVLVSTGLWSARYNSDDFLEAHNTALRFIIEAKVNHSDTPINTAPVIAIPPSYLNYEKLNPSRAATLTAARLAELVRHLSTFEEASGIEVAWVARQMTKENSWVLDRDGLHVTKDIAAIQVDVLLNRICNNKIFSGNPKASTLACVGRTTLRPRRYITFGALLIWLTVCLIQLYLKVDQKLQWTRNMAVLTILLVGFYSWFADRTSLFPKSSKLVSARLFTIVSGAVLGAGVIRVRRIQVATGHVLPRIKTNDNLGLGDSGFLSRTQTEEWKGWMQIVILLYHYFGMSKVLWVYRLVRVLVASYLFLTGYGHACHSQNVDESSVHRVLLVLTRLNVLPCFLAAVMDNAYDFYYFPGLASVWFLTTCITFWRVKGRKTSGREYLLRIFFSCCVTRGLFSANKVVSGLLHGLHKIKGPRINPEEFLFRVKLDFYAPYLGMLFSVVHKQYWPSLKDMKAPSLRFSQLALQIIRAGIACSFVMVYHLISRNFEDKYAYNNWHPILSALPITAYIILRNISVSAQKYVSPIFVCIGTISLELFVLQYHIWLAADTKALLRLGILDNHYFAAGKTVLGSWTYWAETVIVTAIFVWVSNCMAQATKTLVTWFMDNQSNGRQQKTARFLPLRLGILLTLMWMFNLFSNMYGF